jgi:hypothetical protein
MYRNCVCQCPICLLFCHTSTKISIFVCLWCHYYSQKDIYIYIQNTNTNSWENTCTSYHNIGKWWSEVMGGGNGVNWFCLVSFGADTQFWWCHHNVFHGQRLFTSICHFYDQINRKSDLLSCAINCSEVTAYYKLNCIATLVSYLNHHKTTRHIVHKFQTKRLRVLK